MRERESERGFLFVKGIQTRTITKLDIQVGLFLQHLKRYKKKMQIIVRNGNDLFQIEKMK